LALEPVDLGAAIREVVTRAAEELARAGCEVKLDLADGVVGRWDRSRLERITANLIANALKYGAGSPIEIALRSDDAAAELSVRDHGIGISSEDQQRIFQRFERAVSERHFGGLGLGLFVARYMAEALGGQLRVISELGAGSTFIVTLPR